MGDKCKVAIMQPYFLPYIGYWQLINAVDKFVVYDNIQYTKKGWVNRNRFLQNGKDKLFSLPLKSDSYYLDIKDRFLSEKIEDEQGKLLRKFNSSYRTAPFFKDVMPIIIDCIFFEKKNLFAYVYNSIIRVCKFLNINTKIIVSSQLHVNHQLKGHNRVIDICKAINAHEYINPVGGMDLYSKEVFKQNGIKLSFIKPKLIEYKQTGIVFIPWLSIVDVMMFNDKRVIIEMLDEIEFR